MAQLGIENTAHSACSHESPKQDPEPTVGIIPGECGKIPIWRLELEPRHLIAEGRAYVSAIAYGGE
jgi:hypothetical protein